MFIHYYYVPHTSHLRGASAILKDCVGYNRCLLRYGGLQASSVPRIGFLLFTYAMVVAYRALADA